MTWQSEALLYATTFVAGFLNATVGGGGLLQIPMLMLLLPGAPLAHLIGTAKVAGFPGLAVAGVVYSRKLTPAWPLIFRAGAAEIPFAVLGALLATKLSPAWVRPIILVVLLAMAIPVIEKPTYGEAKAGPPRLAGPLPWLVGAGIGLYEGFLGSGSGSILIVVFVTACGLDLVGAAVASAMVTLAGVAAAVVTFVAAGSVLLPLALKMVVFNVAGALLGARQVTLQGNLLLRRLLGVVLLLLIARLTWDMFTLHQ